MTDTETIRPLSCGHKFHTSCITRWLTKNNTCPLCRKELGQAAVADDDDELNDLNWYWTRRASTPIREVWLYANERSRLARLARAEADLLAANAISETSYALREHARLRAERARANYVFWLQREGEDGIEVMAAARAAVRDGTATATESMAAMEVRMAAVKAAAARHAAMMEEEAAAADIEEVAARAADIEEVAARAADIEEAAAALEAGERQMRRQRPRSWRQRQRSRRQGRQRGMRPGSGKRRWML